LSSPQSSSGFARQIDELVQPIAQQLVAVMGPKFLV
jgi:hypothetical protein